MLGLIKHLPQPFAFTVGQRVTVSSGWPEDESFEAGTVVEPLSAWLVRVRFAEGDAVCSTTRLALSE